MSNEIESLVEQAERSLDQSNNTSVRHRSHRNTSSATKVLQGLIILIAAIITYLSIDSLTPMTELDEVAIQTNLLSILRQARDSVESNRDANGTPPASLPNASLARIIYYRVSGKDYELTLYLNNNTATLDYDGNFILNGESINAD